MFTVAALLLITIPLVSVLLREHLMARPEPAQPAVPDAEAET